MVRGDCLILEKSLCYLMREWSVKAFGESCTKPYPCYKTMYSQCFLLKYFSKSLGKVSNTVIKPKKP